jgi:hypothetical protein
MHQPRRTFLSWIRPKGWVFAALILAGCLAIGVITQASFEQEDADRTFLPLISGGQAQMSSQEVSSAAVQCINDTAGANDEPGQKDLTQLCVDYAGVPTSIAVSWNWDEISVQGANTLDACSLYDTDGDGNINYSLCVTTTDGSTVATSLYSCRDDKPDRCTSPFTSISLRACRIQTPLRLATHSHKTWWRAVPFS